MQVALTRAQAEAKWEGYCDPTKGCHTVCCHHEGSPCEHLEWIDEAKKIGRCRIYATRFGIRKTVDGQVFRCAPMREWLMHKPAPAHCGYAVVRSIERRPVATDSVNGNLPLVAGMA